MKYWYGMAFASFIAAIACGLASWSQAHNLSPRQQTLLSSMIDLQKDRSTYADRREAGLRTLEGLAADAASNQQWQATAIIAHNADEDAHDLNAHVQPLEDRWLAAQQEFSALTAARLQSSRHEMLHSVFFIGLLIVSFLWGRIFEAKGSALKTASGS